MKTLVNLTATLTETDFREGPGHHHHVGQQHEVVTTDGRKGIFTRRMRIGPDGVIFMNGRTDAVVIPTAELWKLIEEIEPSLRIPEKITVPAKAGAPKP